MLELSIKEKEKIGKLLKYYRKKNKILWKEIEKIISKSTYSKIEKGYAAKKEEIYYHLFKLYGLSFRKKMNFNEWLNDYLIRMNNILEYYEEDDFNSLSEELEKELGTYRSTIIYEQYYQVITYILNYYKYSKYMTLEEIEDCFKLFECIEFEETIMIYLLEVMFISNNNSINDNQFIERTYIQSLNYQESPIIWYIQAGYFKIQALFETSLELFSKTFDYYAELNNRYRFTKALMGKYIIYKNIDFKKAEDTLELLIQLKEENKLNKSMIPNINFNIGMYYYLNNNYEKAYELFIENINNYHRNREWFYICAICTQLKISIPKEFETYNVQDNEDPIIMEYFYMKYNKYPKKKLVNYIMKIILPQYLVNQNYRQPYWALFEEEIIAFANKDKRFTDTLLEFLEVEKKTCKKY